MIYNVLELIYNLMLNFSDDWHPQVHLGGNWWDSQHARLMDQGLWMGLQIFKGEQTL